MNMKKPVVVSVFMAAFLSSVAVGVDRSQAAVSTQEIASAVRGVPAVELGPKAAELVASAPEGQRISVAVDVVRTIVKTRPGAVMMVIASVAKAVPETAPAVAAAGVQLVPQFGLAIAKAAARAAPEKAEEIAVAMGLVSKTQAADVAAIIRQAVPRAKDSPVLFAMLFPKRFQAAARAAGAGETPQVNVVGQGGERIRQAQGPISAIREFGFDVVQQLGAAGLFGFTPATLKDFGGTEFIPGQSTVEEVINKAIDNVPEREIQAKADQILSDPTQAQAVTDAATAVVRNALLVTEVVKQEIIKQELLVQETLRQQVIAQEVVNQTLIDNRKAEIKQANPDITDAEINTQIATEADSIRSQAVQLITSQPESDLVVQAVQQVKTGTVSQDIVQQAETAIAQGAVDASITLKVREDVRAGNVDETIAQNVDQAIATGNVDETVVKKAQVVIDQGAVDQTILETANQTVAAGNVSADLVNQVDQRIQTDATIQTQLEQVKQQTVDAVAKANAATENLGAEAAPTTDFGAIANVLGGNIFAQFILQPQTLQTANPQQGIGFDTNGDGTPDEFDTDFDGIIDARDLDGDGTIDQRIIDTDNNGVPDSVVNVDANGNVIPGTEKTILENAVEQVQQRQEENNPAQAVTDIVSLIVAGNAGQIELAPGRVASPVAP